MAVSKPLRVVLAIAILTGAALLPRRWATALADLGVVAFAGYEARRMYRLDPERHRWHEPVDAVGFYVAVAIAVVLAAAVAVALAR